MINILSVWKFTHKKTSLQLIAFKPYNELLDLYTVKFACFYYVFSI